MWPFSHSVAPRARTSNRRVRQRSSSKPVLRPPKLAPSARQLYFTKPEPRAVREPACPQRGVALSHVAGDEVEAEGVVSVEVGHWPDAVCRASGDGRGGAGGGPDDGDGGGLEGATGGEVLTNVIYGPSGRNQRLGWTGRRRIGGRRRRRLGGGDGLRRRGRVRLR